MTKYAGWIVAGLLGLLVLVVSSKAQESDGTASERPPLMTAERLGELILRVEETALQEGSTWLFFIDDKATTVVYDVAADRMRIVIPVIETEGMTEADLTRVMQANFDSALDARYAIADGMLWATFIHPLSTLTDEQFIVGLAQTVNIVATYGTSYSSGLFLFGGGDSAAIERRRFIEELRDKTET